MNSFMLALKEFNIHEDEGKEVIEYNFTSDLKKNINKLIIIKEEIKLDYEKKIDIINNNFDVFYNYITYLYSKFYNKIIKYLVSKLINNYYNKKINTNKQLNFDFNNINSFKKYRLISLAHSFIKIKKDLLELNEDNITKKKEEFIYKNFNYRVKKITEEFKTNYLNNESNFIIGLEKLIISLTEDFHVLDQQLIDTINVKVDKYKYEELKKYNKLSNN